MPLPATFTLRDATLDELPAIAALRASVGWGVQEWALRAVIGHRDARCLVASDDESELAGVGSGIVYGPLGFVGNMVVSPDHRRRGLGSAILAAIIEFLEGAGCRRLELNATSDGRPLYERHGFAAIGTSATAEVPRSTPLGRHARIQLRRAGAADVNLVAAYDQPRFGGDRRRILELILADPEALNLLATRDRSPIGYASVRGTSGRIGPFLADEPAVAEALLAGAFDVAPAADALRLNLPPGNVSGARWLRSLGVAIEGWEGRMARGPEIPKRDDTIYGMAVGALG